MQNLISRIVIVKDKTNLLNKMNKFLKLNASDYFDFDEEEEEVELALEVQNDTI